MANVEPLHDMRVATRRLRAALEVFKPCFPRKRHRSALKRVKALADALGERRDRDVSIEFLEAFRRDAPAAERTALETLIGRLRDEQTAANEALAPYLEAKKLRKLRRRLRELVKAAKA
jgi:CHAD domain-containing protein